MSKRGTIKRRELNIETNKESNQYSIYKKWVVVAIELMYDGFSTSYIREHILANKREGSRAESTIDNIMSDANSYICNQYATQSKDVVAIHVRRYNNLINELLAVEELPYPERNESEDYLVWVVKLQKWQESRERKIAAYLNAIDTMYQKEKLLQYHSKGFEVQVNLFDETIVKEEKIKFNINKLPFDEQLELLKLFSKAKKEDFVLAGITEAGQAARIETVEGEAVVIEKPNVEEIKHKEIPVQPYISPVTQFDPTIKLRESLKQLVAKKIQEAGGKLTDEEKQLIK